MSEIFPVLICRSGITKRYSPEFQNGEQYAAAWHGVLKAAYRTAVASCACGGTGPARLAIKLFSASDSFYLAKFGRTGAQHSPSCQFWSASASDSAEAYTAGVIKERDDGSVQIRLAFGLTATCPTGEADDRPRNQGGSRHSQSAMRLLGLLHYLWIEAGLNSWRRGWENRRTKWTVYGRINNAASSVMIGKRDLSTALLLPADTPGCKAAERNRDRVSSAIQANSRLIVIAPLARHSEQQEAALERQLKIAGFQGIPPIFVKPGFWATCRTRYQPAITAWKNGSQVIAIAQVELKTSEKGVTAHAVDIALMATTDKWIPFDSTYERMVAERLVREMRSFRKPMRFDRAEDDVLPDFVLEDTLNETPCEVFGRTDPEYRVRIREKEEIYGRKYGTQGWWSWDAASNPDPASMPDFPPPR